MKYKTDANIIFYLFNEYFSFFFQWNVFSFWFFFLLRMGILELKIQSHLMCKRTMNKNMPKIILFLLFMYCLTHVYGKILKYMSFTIYIQSSLRNKPSRNKLIQGLLFRWAICGPWASCNFFCNYWVYLWPIYYVKAQPLLNGHYARCKVPLCILVS